ncbi:MAG: hypothetical protein GY724_22985, partial [Actinomycetia bacterium]|nr:hypothetical protein [Actinomycetes bacterium]
PETGQTFQNDGTMEAAGTGGLAFSGGTFVNNTSIDVLTGSKLDLNNGTTLQGGTLMTAGSGVINVNGTTASDVVLDGITNQGSVAQFNSKEATVVNGLTNDGTWQIFSAGSTTGLEFSGTQTLGGTGSIVMNNNTWGRLLASGGTVTNGANHTIQGGGTIEGSWLNLGTLDVGGSNIFRATSGLMTNDGAIQTSGSAKFEVETSVGGTGTWTAAGGTIQVESTGAITNAGLVAVQSGGMVAVQSGGSVQTTSLTQTGGVVDVVGNLSAGGVDVSGGQLGVQSGGAVQATSLTLQSGGAIDVGGTLNVGAGGMNIIGGQLSSIGGAVNLTGAGQLLSNSGFMQLANTAVTLPGGASLNNLGGGTIQMGGGSIGGTVHNAGLMQLTNTVGMNTLNIASTGTVDLQAGFLQLQNDMQIQGRLINTISNLAKVQHDSFHSLILNLIGMSLMGGMGGYGGGMDPMVIAIAMIPVAAILFGIFGCLG